MKLLLSSSLTQGRRTENLRLPQRKWRGSQRKTKSLETHYGDLLRALRFAGTSDRIDEIAALRELVLAVGAAAMGSIEFGKPASDLNLLARRLLGDKAELFDIAMDQSAEGTRGVTIQLKSSVLSVRGFPIRIESAADLVAQIDRQMGLAGTENDRGGSRMGT